MKASVFKLGLSPQIAWGRGSAHSAVNQIAQLELPVMLVHGVGYSRIEWFYEALVAQGCDVSCFVCAHEPDIDLIEQGALHAREVAVGVVVAIGGGSVIDCAKAIAGLAPAAEPLIAYLEVVGGGQPLINPPLPLIALPTTAGTGAEATANAVIAVPEAKRKVSLRDKRLLPKLAVVDPSLTDGCPRAVTLASGLDAVTQVIEPYLSCRANRFTDALCRSAIPLGLAALQRLMAEEDQNARDDMAWCSFCGGVALANAGLGAVHGLAGPLGGVMTGPHGAIAGRLLPAVLRENRAVAPLAMHERFDEVDHWIAQVLKVPVDQAIDSLEYWVDQWGLPRLEQMGLAEQDIEAIASAAQSASSMRGNPVQLTDAQLVDILRRSI